jgi:hypothetical protein
MRQRLTVCPVDRGCDVRTTLNPLRTTHSGGVSFGAQHLLGEHFAIYGELGLSYDRLTTDLPAGEARGNAFATRSGVGVVVYF